MSQSIVILSALIASGVVLSACAAGDAAEPAGTVPPVPAVEPVGPSVDAASVDRVEGFEPVTDDVLVLPDGWYEMAGYGTVLAVDGDEITMHHVTASTCTVADTIDNELPVDHAHFDGVATVDLVGPTTDYRLLPLAEALQCDSGDDATLTALDEVFATHYPFFDERGLVWADESARIASADDVEVGLGEFMLRLGDGHTTFDELDIDVDPTVFGVETVSTMEQLSDLVDHELTATLDRISDLQVDESGSVGWGLLDDGTTGYLFLGRFEGLAGTDDPTDDVAGLRAAMAAAISDLTGRTDRLIVDARFNAGGYEDLAVLAAGAFVDEPTEAYRKWAYAQPDPTPQTITIEPAEERFDGEVVVLTSPITASAAEAFTLSMREAVGAHVVGTATFGEFSDAIDWVLPNGTEFTMSMEVYTDLDGVNHEAIGLQPDVVAPFDQTLDAGLAVLHAP